MKPKPQWSPDDNPIRVIIKEHIFVLNDILCSPILGQLNKAAQLCIEALKRGNKIMLCGNGGSAANAQHIAAELVGRFRKERKPLPALALTTDTSILTAIANDFGYGEVFARQVEALGTPGDVLIAISTSGESANICHVLGAAEKRGVDRIVLTRYPFTFNMLYSPLIILGVPSTDTARIQECHILFGHILCELIEEAFL